jgi:hypothetical protein
MSLASATDATGPAAEGARPALPLAPAASAPQANVSPATANVTAAAVKIPQADLCTGGLLTVYLPTPPVGGHDALAKVTQPTSAAKRRSTGLLAAGPRC